MAVASPHDATSLPTAISKPAKQSSLSSVVLAMLKRAVQRAVASLGNSKESLCAPWVGRLCIFNAVLYIHSAYGQMEERRKFPVKHGQAKVASFGVMNAKYAGIFKAVL